MPTTVDSKYELWKTRLLDLSKRNRLLFFKQVKRGNVQIIEPGAETIFGWLVRSEGKLTFPQSIEDPAQLLLDDTLEAEKSPPSGAAVPLRDYEMRTKATDAKLATTLYNIRSKARTALEEQGVNVLYLAFGMLTWYEAESSTEPISSPLVLVPVELDRPGSTRPYTLEMLDEEVLLNPTISYKMQKDYGLALPLLPEEWQPSGLEPYLALVRDSVSRQRRWAVNSDVHLGLFSFEKLVMLKDLESNASLAKAHPLVTALAGDRSQVLPVPSDIPSPEELDSKIVPEDTFQILDADSSQQETIAYAKRDVSIVIQGPPGTGKSQTIANIIAERLAQGKKVLFVSEKMAALEVVHKRLAQCGLDEFCLEAHSHKSKKSDIIARLGKSLNSTLSVNRDSHEAELRQVANLRGRLNQYATALHTPRTPLRRTPFQVHGLLAALTPAPDLAFSLADVGQADIDRLSNWEQAIEALVAEASVWDTYDTHPWRGTLLRDLTFESRANIESHLRSFVGCLVQLESITSNVAQRLGMNRPSCLADLEPFVKTGALVADTPFPPIEWLKTLDTGVLRNMALQAKEAYGVYLGNQQKVLGLHTQALLDFDDLPELVRRFETSYRGVLRVLKSGYRRDLRRIQSTTVKPQRVGYVQALTVLQLANSIRAVKEWIDAHRAEHQRAFGDLFQATETDWVRILSALEWAESLLSRFPQGELPESLLNLVCDGADQIALVGEPVCALQELTQRARLELEFFTTLFPIDKVKIDKVAIDRSSFEQLRNRLQLRLDHLDDLRAWVDFDAAWRKCEQQGLGLFLQAARGAKVTSQQLLPAFYRQFYRLWLDVAYGQEPALKSFRSDVHSGTIEQFRQLDSKQLQFAKHRVAARLAALRPRTNFVEAPSSEVSILRHQMELTRRHMPIRRLFAQIPNLLLALKPCLMMSPLSVSQFLSAGSFQFDTVIFDEASQICPEDAIGSVMRGKQIVVAGDRHQLPPTSFFRSLGIDSDDGNQDEEGSEILDSILQECTVFMPSPTLKWHYRSRHESLIAFSNHKIYDDQLITFPNSRLAEERLGVEFVHVPDGVYDRGRTRQNRVEAKRVAELICEHFDACPDLSLGVVAFSEAQREAIVEELRRMARDRLDVEALLNQKGQDAFFIKNLENVQGDERDVIFFSVGYGRDAVGRITMNFGPLNGENGGRRLNVAITRARLHIKFVSSILPEDMDAAFPNKGVQLLRHYMEYARQGGKREALYGEIEGPSGDSESPFEDAVYAALGERGLTLHKQVGCSGYRIDLAAVDPEHPGRYLLGIECDGATYHSAKTARDRDRLRQQVLEGLGWHIHRVWSRDWIANPSAQVQRILDAIERAKREPVRRMRPTAPAPPPAPEIRTLGFEIAQVELANGTANARQLARRAALPSGVQMYKTAGLRHQGAPDRFNVDGQDIIERLLVQVAEEEGPIHMDDVCRRIAGCWDISRVGKRIEARITNIARSLAVDQRLVLRDRFLWPKKAGVLIVRRPPQGESPRPIEHIAREEIAQAAYLCLKDAFSLDGDDLVGQTARLFGFERTGEKVRTRIEESLALLLTQRRATRANGKLELVR